MPLSSQLQADFRRDAASISDSVSNGTRGKIEQARAAGARVSSIHDTHLPFGCGVLPGPELSRYHTGDGSLSQVKVGKEADFVRVYSQAWDAYKRLGMVIETPHILLGAKDDAGKPYFIDVLTWRNHDIPDHVLPAVREIWNQMDASGCEMTAANVSIPVSTPPDRRIMISCCTATLAV